MEDRHHARTSCTVNVSLLPSKTGSFDKSIVAVCDYEKQFFGAIIRCAIGKLTGTFRSFLPSPIKRRPRRGLYKEGILKSFRFFYRSHYSLLVTTSNYAEKTSVPPSR